MCKRTGLDRTSVLFTHAIPYKFQPYARQITFEQACQTPAPAVSWVPTTSCLERRLLLSVGNPRRARRLRLEAATACTHMARQRHIGQECCRDAAHTSRHRLRLDFLSPGEDGQCTKHSGERFPPSSAAAVLLFRTWTTSSSSSWCDSPHLQARKRLAELQGLPIARLNA